MPCVAEAATESDVGAASPVSGSARSIPTGSASMATVRWKAPSRKSVHVTRSSRCGPYARVQARRMRSLGIVARWESLNSRGSAPGMSMVMTVPMGASTSPLSEPQHPDPKRRCHVSTEVPSAASNCAWAVESPATRWEAGGDSAPCASGRTILIGTRAPAACTYPPKPVPTRAEGQGSALACGAPTSPAVARAHAASNATTGSRVTTGVSGPRPRRRARSDVRRPR